MRDVTSAGPTPSRRLVTAGVLGAAVVVLSGCGIRLEDDAPRVPLVPTRSPIDGEDSLVRLLAAIQVAARAPVDAKAPISALLAPLHTRQATVLHDALRQRGVPAEELPAATPSPTPSASAPSGSTAPTPSTSATQAPAAPSTVAAVENSILTAAIGVQAASADLRPTLLSTLAQAHAVLDLAGVTATPEPALTPSAGPSTDPAWSRPQALAPLISAVRTATYLLQVAGARSPLAVRDAARQSLTALHTLTSEMVEAAGDAAPAPDLGITLPHPVTTPAQAATLATEALTSLLSTFGSHLSLLGEDDAAAAFATVPRWLGTVAAQGHRHGIALTPFPGLE